MSVFSFEYYLFCLKDKFQKLTRKKTHKPFPARLCSIEFSVHFISHTKVSHFSCMEILSLVFLLIFLCVLLLLKYYTIWEGKQKSPIFISFTFQSLFLLFKLNYPFLVFTPYSTKPVNCPTELYVYAMQS